MEIIEMLRRIIKTNKTGPDEIEEIKKVIREKKLTFDGKEISPDKIEAIRKYIIDGIEREEREMHKH